MDKCNYCGLPPTVHGNVAKCSGPAHNGNTPPINQDMPTDCADQSACAQNTGNSGRINQDRALEAVKPLDLSNCLKHAHAAGQFGVDWVDYEAGPSHSYARVTAALQQPAPMGVDAAALKSMFSLGVRDDQLIDKITHYLGHLRTETGWKTIDSAPRKHGDPIWGGHYLPSGHFDRQLIQWHDNAQTFVFYRSLDGQKYPATHFAELVLPAAPEASEG